MKKSRKIIICVIAAALVLLIICRLADYMVGFDQNAAVAERERRICYLLNIDGMGGLGHVAFMLEDTDGSGILYSYNGMQYDLKACLLGKEGVGKMKVFELDADDVADLYKTGMVSVSDVSECDDFDRIIFRSVSEEEYLMVAESVQEYITAGDRYEELFAIMANATATDKVNAQAELDAYSSRDDLPKYNIYKHNCDTVARIVIAGIDDGMAGFNENNSRLIPSNNCRKMSKVLKNGWNKARLGEDTLKERILWFIL